MKTFGFCVLMVAVFLQQGLAHRVQAAELISAKSAHQRALKGDLILLDVRRSDEWKQSGVAASAKLISMYEDGFLTRLLKLTGEQKDKAIALICATGARSTWLSGQLEARGYTNVLNVREGMFGSQYGAGWIAQKLPIRRTE